MANYFKIPGSVLINKFDLNREMAGRIKAYCREKGLGLVGNLPYDPAVTEAMIQGKTILEWSRNGLGAEIKTIWGRIQEHLLED